VHRTSSAPTHARYQRQRNREGRLHPQFGNNIASLLSWGRSRRPLSRLAQSHEYIRVRAQPHAKYSLVYTRYTPTLGEPTARRSELFQTDLQDFDTHFNPAAAGMNTGVTNPHDERLGPTFDSRIRRDRADAAAGPAAIPRVTLKKFSDTTSTATVRSAENTGAPAWMGSISATTAARSRSTARMGPWANDSSVGGSVKSPGFSRRRRAILDIARGQLGNY